jgi:poly-gamma-glutamate synthesis protein (capsule biosynthesis protein)
MKIKPNPHIHTFLLISIILCIFIGSTTIIFAIYEINSQIALNSSDNKDIVKKEKAPSQPAFTTSRASQVSTTASSITIAAVGDIMAHQGNLDGAYDSRKNTYDFNGFLEAVKPYLTAPDLTIGNFETVTAGPASGYSSFPMFNTPDAMLTALSGAGFDVLSTANNHCLDRGVSGLVRTIKKINENKMNNVGSSVDGKNKYTIKEINNIKIAILSYSSFYNGNDKKLSFNQKSTHLSPINEAQIKSDIKAVKAKGADAIITIMHWGTEYKREPDAGQATLSNKLFSWGADIILGSHPHIIQKSEIKKIGSKNKFVIYSMGNFISGYRRTDRAKRPNKIYTEDGVIVRFNIEKDPKGGIIIKKADYIPTWVDKTYAKGKPVFKIIPIPSSNPSGQFITKNNLGFVKQSYKNTMGIMSRLN